MSGQRRGRRAPATPALSIVIPAYNEARRLPASLQAIRRFLARQGWEATTEVIVVDDGSADGTAAVAAQFIRQWPRLSVITLPHAGKGAAIRQGALAARGAQIFFCDADLSMPIDLLPRFLPPEGSAADIVIASREAPGARRFGEPALRHLMGRVFNRLVQALVLPGLDDTQCGFKRLTRAAAQEICGDLRLAGWGFDVELLALARVRGYTIAEVPIDWQYGAESRVRPLRDTLRMVREVWQVRRRLRSALPLLRRPASSEPTTPAARPVAAHATTQESL